MHDVCAGEHMPVLMRVHRQTRMDISCAVLPTPRHAFFEQTVFKGQFGDDLFQRRRLAAKVLV
jgi:hypothetical protein